MYMRPCCPSGGSNFGYGVAAGHPVSNSDKILSIVSVQHLPAIFRLYQNHIAVTAVRSAFNDTSSLDSPGNSSRSARPARNGLATWLFQQLSTRLQARRAAGTALLFATRDRVPVTV